MMKKQTGAIEIVVSNRIDGTPIMELKAEDPEGRKILSRVETALSKARLLAVSMGRADILGVCDYKEEKDEIVVLKIPMALGGIGLAFDKPIRKKK
jgi:hypothetical protein